MVMPSVDCGPKSHRRTLVYSKNPKFRASKFRASLTLSYCPEEWDGIGSITVVSKFDVAITEILTMEEMRDNWKHGLKSEPRAEFTFSNLNTFAPNALEASRQALQCFLDDNYCSYTQDEHFRRHLLRWKDVIWHVEAVEEEIVQLLEQVITAKMGFETEKLVTR